MNARRKHVTLSLARRHKEHRIKRTVGFDFDHYPAASAPDSVRTMWGNHLREQAKERVGKRNRSSVRGEVPHSTTRMLLNLPAYNRCWAESGVGVVPHSTTRMLLNLPACLPAYYYRCWTRSATSAANAPSTRWMRTGTW